MPIAIAPIEKYFKVIRITANEETKRHIESIGITVDCKIQVVAHSGKTSICLVRNTRLAIDGNLAMQIFVA